MLTEAALAHRGPVARRAGDEPAHVGARGDAGERGAARARAGSSSSAPPRASSPRASRGLGRMASREEIFARCEELLGGRRTASRGRRVLVTAGGTREPLDAVRFVGNRSSGRMGVALAAEARRPRRRASRCSPRTSPWRAPAGVEVVRHADRSRRGARGAGPGRTPTSS